MLVSIPVARAQSETLLLEIWINGKTHHDLARTIVGGDGAISADCADLMAAGLRVAKEEECALSNVAGLTAIIDKRDQRLTITASNANLMEQIVSVRPSAFEQAEQAHPSASGAVLTYDTSAEAADLARPGKSGSAGAALNLAAFEPWGTFRADGFADVNAAGSRLVRLDSAFSFENQEALQRISIGDTITSDVSWSRSVRIAGFQIARDFQLQPDLVTQPMPQYFGESAVPSTLDVFVNNAKVFEEKIEQGPFQVRDLPAITGASQVTIVTSDVLGRQSTQTLSLYTSKELLAKGLSEYSADVGFLRLNYGLDSLSYGDFIATASGRHGVTDWLTVEGHGEAGAGIVQGGLGAVVAVAPYGVVSLALAASRWQGGTGAFGTAGLQMQLDPFSLFGQVAATAGAYRDIAASNGPAPPRLREQLGTNLALGNYGSFSLSWVNIQRPQQHTQFATATYSVSVGAGYALNLTGYRDLESQISGAELFLSIPLGEKTRGELSTQLGQSAPQDEAAVTQPADPYGGFGYRVSALSGPSHGAEGTAIWTGQDISANGGVSSVNGVTAARAGASGSLVAIGGDVYAARRVDGAIALVDAGQEGVRIYQENREVAVTGPDGTALVTGLVPYGRNTIGVSAEDYPMDVVMSAPERTIVPDRFGAVVNFAPPVNEPVLIALELPDGKFPLLGTHVALDDIEEPLVVGAHGRIFIAHLPAAARGHVLLAQGACDFFVIPPKQPQDGSIPEIGPVQCTMEKDHEATTHS